MEAVSIIRGRVARRPMVRNLLIAAALAACGATSASAQELDGFLEWFWSRTDQLNEREALPTVNFQSTVFRQRYNLDFRWRLYPNVNLTAGGLFEQDAASNFGVSLPGDSTLRKFRPYVTLRQSSRLFFTNIDANRQRDRIEGSGSSAEETLDSFNAAFGWRPDPFPRLSLRFQRTDNYDGTRQLLDTTRDLTEFRLQYQALDRVQVNYRIGRDEVDNRLEANRIERDFQNGNVSYADQYLQRRIQFSANYDFDFQETEAITSGGGEIGTQLRPDQGLSALTDFPETVVLLPNPLLIDENFVASAGINLGVVPPGGDERPRNIGLDLGEPVALNQLRLWIDAELTLVIANSFVWDIYSSEDNLEWTYRETVAPAQFATLENRWDLRFTEITTRFVKVVTRPLDPSVPGATQFPDIFVTELEAFLFLPAGEVEDQSTVRTQRLTTDLRIRLVRTRNIFYEFSYSARDNQDLPLLWQLSNGISFRERLNRTFTLSGRVSRLDEDDRTQQTVALLYTASLRAAAIETLTQTLLFTGRHDDVEEGSSYTNSVFLYNALNIYRGLTANIGMGTAGSKRLDGERVTTRQLNGTATLTPHRTFTANLQYVLTNTDRSGGEFPVDRTEERGISSISVAYTPLSAIYLFAAYRVESNSEGQDLTTRNYSFSWNPLAGGNLQLSFRYNETFRDELNTLFRIFTTRARWNVTPRWFMELAWEDSRTKTDISASFSDVLRAQTRLVF